MWRQLVLASCCCYHIALRSGVMAFIPSTSSSLGINPPQQLLKGACSITKRRAASQPAAKVLSPKSTRTVPILQAKSSNDDTASNKKASINKENKQLSNSSKKKRPMAISEQSLTSAQKSSNSLSSLEKNQKQQQEQQQKQQQQEDQEQRAYNELLPKTGYSLADSLEKSSDKELFETILTPISGVYNADGVMLNTDEEEMMMEFEYDEDGFPVGVKKKNTDDSSNNNSAKEDGEECSSKQEHDGIARIDTISNYGGIEPVRWIVSMGRHDSEERESHVMIDLPPYSDKLANEIRCFMDPEYNNTTTTSKPKQQTKGTTTLDAILLTNQQCIHYDSSPGVYVTRKSDLTKWKKAFPEAKVVMYRLDIPRECREEVTQILDGYGPWGWKDEEEAFVETGRPLTIEEWDEDTKSRVLKDGELPPGDERVLDDDEESNDEEEDDDSDPRYTKEAIREREEQHRLLAVYTPGHTFGSVTYIFPRRNICCSGFALPLESSNSVTMNDLDDDDDDDDGFDEYGRSGSFGSAPPIGPRLDYQGYLATSASRPRQMSSALSLINNYIDRFRVVLPARGDILFLDSDEDKRKRDLMESVGLYRKISDIYGRLGIVE